MTGQIVSDLLFYCFAAVAIVLAIAAVTTTRIFRAALYLMGVLLCTAAFYVLLGSEFLAGLQVLIYVGGVVVLLVFAVMLTHKHDFHEEPASIARRVTAFIGSGLFVFCSTYVFSIENFRPLRAEAVSSGDPRVIGRSFLDYGAGGYALPFEVISVLLLAAIIGGIVIARKKVPGSEVSK